MSTEGVSTEGVSTEGVSTILFTKINYCCELHVGTCLSLCYHITLTLTSVCGDRDLGVR